MRETIWSKLLKVEMVCVSWVRGTALFWCYSAKAEQLLVCQHRRLTRVAGSVASYAAQIYHEWEQKCLWTGPSSTCSSSRRRIRTFGKITHPPDTSETLLGQTMDQNHVICPNITFRIHRVWVKLLMRVNTKLFLRKGSPTTPYDLEGQESFGRACDHSSHRAEKS